MENIFNSNYFGLFFALILILIGCMFYLFNRKLWRVLKGRRTPSKKEVKRINNISLQIYHEHTLTDAYNIAKHRQDRVWEDAYEKSQMEMSHFPDHVIRIRMLAGGVLIFVGTVILILWLI